MKKLFTATVIVSTLLFLSCAPTLSNISYGNAISYLPYKSAIFIKRNLQVKMCIKGSNVCITKTMSLRGSGSVIKNVGKDSLMLTARHVCEFSPPDPKDLPDEVDVAVSVLQTLAYDYDGNAMEVNVVKSDQVEDICIMKIKNYNGQVVRLSDRAPSVGDRVFNVGFPAGMYMKRVSMFYEGFFGGNAEKLPFPRTVENPLAVYTIPVVGGQSGSMLLNTRGELIGMIHSGIAGFNSMAFSPTYEVLKKFLKDL